MGQAILPKLLRCIHKTYSSSYHYASYMLTQIRTEIGEAIAASAAALLTNYQDASHMAELEPTFRQGADTWAKHLVTSAAGRAATFGMILIVQGFQITNRNWHIRCSNLFACYESCNQRVHKNETVNNERTAMPYLPRPVTFYGRSFS